MTLAMWMLTSPWAILAAAGLTLGSLMVIFIKNVFLAVELLLGIDRKQKRK